MMAMLLLMIYAAIGAAIHTFDADVAFSLLRAMLMTPRRFRCR